MCSVKSVKQMQRLHQQIYCKTFFWYFCMARVWKIVQVCVCSSVYVLKCSSVYMLHPPSASRTLWLARWVWTLSSPPPPPA